MTSINERAAKEAIKDNSIKLVNMLSPPSEWALKLREKSMISKETYDKATNPAPFVADNIKTIDMLKDIERIVGLNPRIFFELVDLIQEAPQGTNLANKLLESYKTHGGNRIDPRPAVNNNEPQPTSSSSGSTATRDGEIRHRNTPQQLTGSPPQQPAGSPQQQPTGSPPQQPTGSRSQQPTGSRSQLQRWTQYTFQSWTKLGLMLLLISNAVFLAYFWLYCDCKWGFIEKLCAILYSLISIGIPVWWLIGSCQQIEKDKTRRSKETDFGTELPHGELIVEKYKWDVVANCVIHGSCKGNFTAFLVNWQGSCYFVTTYHSYLGKKDTENSKSPYWKPKKLREDGRLEHIGDNILNADYTFLFNSLDREKPVSAKGNGFLAGCTVHISCEMDILIVNVRTDSLPSDVVANFDKLQDTSIYIEGWNFDDEKDRKSFYERFLDERTVVIYGHPHGNSLSRSAGDIKEDKKKKFIEEGEMYYHIRTKEGSSGSPVLVTWEIRNENYPMVVGVHSDSGPRSNKHNIGHFLLPFLNDAHNGNNRGDYVEFVLEGTG